MVSHFAPAVERHQGMHVSRRRLPERTRRRCGSLWWATWDERVLEQSKMPKASLCSGTGRNCFEGYADSCFLNMVRIYWLKPSFSDTVLGSEAFQVTVGIHLVFGLLPERSWFSEKGHAPRTAGCSVALWRWTPSQHPFSLCLDPLAPSDPHARVMGPQD